MKLKKFLLAFVCTVMMFYAFGMITPAYATDEVQELQSISEQMNAFNEYGSSLESNPQLDKGQSLLLRTISSTYPTRKGVILVTRVGKSESLVGHAGIIYSPTLTVDSFPDIGVRTFNNNWNTKYKTIYGITTHETTATQDARAVDRAYSHRGKPYNWNFANLNSTSSFYCLQLVYEAYKHATGLNLHGSNVEIVYPINLVASRHVYDFMQKECNV